jgi:uncharacterized protein (TIGR02466 family)
MIDCELIPLFSSPLAVFRITEDISQFEKIKNYTFISTDVDSANSCEITETKKLLNDFPREKEILFSYFNLYKNEVLRLESTEFKITTSWATKTTKGSFSQYHNHKNSFFTSVLYLNDDENAASIQFDSENIFPQDLMLNKPSEWNLFNSKVWTVKPSRNMILFFPSYLRHRIAKHESSKPRYSVAFNLFPSCKFGNGDSMLNLTVNGCDTL